MTTKVKVPARPLYEICKEIKKDWITMPDYAKAHFKAIQFATDVTAGGMV